MSRAPIPDSLPSFPKRSWKEASPSLTMVISRSRSPSSHSRRTLGRPAMSLNSWQSRRTSGRDPGSGRPKGAVSTRSAVQSRPRAAINAESSSCTLACSRSLHSVTRAPAHGWVGSLKAEAIWDRRRTVPSIRLARSSSTSSAPGRSKHRSGVPVSSAYWPIILYTLVPSLPRGICNALTYPSSSRRTSTSSWASTAAPPDRPASSRPVAISLMISALLLLGSCSSRHMSPSPHRSRFPRTTSRAAIFCETKSTRFPWAMSSEIMLVIVWLFPVPGGPCRTKLTPARAACTASSWLESESRT